MISTTTSKIPLAQPLRNLRGCMHRIEGIHWSHAQGGQAHHGDAVSGILCWFISTKEICGVGVFDSCPLAQMIAASFQAYTSCWIFDIKFLCVSIQTQIEDSVLAEIIFVPNGKAQENLSFHERITRSSRLDFCGAGQHNEKSQLGHCLMMKT